VTRERLSNQPIRRPPQQQVGHYQVCELLRAFNPRRQLLLSAISLELVDLFAVLKEDQVRNCRDAIMRRQFSVTIDIEFHHRNFGRIFLQVIKFRFQLPAGSAPIGTKLDQHNVGRFDLRGQRGIVRKGLESGLRSDREHEQRDGNTCHRNEIQCRIELTHGIFHAGDTIVAVVSVGRISMRSRLRVQIANGTQQKSCRDQRLLAFPWNDLTESAGVSCVSVSI
jgi:hypothetical protein